jgi:hypothetical protein
METGLIHNFAAPIRRQTAKCGRFARVVLSHYIMSNDKREFPGDSWEPFMTTAAQRAAIKKMIAEYTTRVTESEEAARNALINEGFYTKDGKLTERYGGRKRAATAK